MITLADRNPAVDGLNLKAGATITVVLPKQFTNLGEGPNSVILLQGWPQSPAFPFPWELAIDGNLLTITLTGDYGPGPVGPGPKQLHLILFGFTNPEEPGYYPIKVTIKPDPASKHQMRRVAVAKIIADVRPSIHAVSLFSGPPGQPPPFFNPIYQTVMQGEAARQVGLHVWDWGGGPAPRRRRRYGLGHTRPPGARRAHRRICPHPGSTRREVVRPRDARRDRRARYTRRPIPS